MEKLNAHKRRRGLVVVNTEMLVVATSEKSSLGFLEYAVLELASARAGHAQYYAVDAMWLEGLRGGREEMA
jgi:hypothetical protein